LRPEEWSAIFARFQSKNAAAVKNDALPEPKKAVAHAFKESIKK
jgi:hypothetical protein